MLFTNRFEILGTLDRLDPAKTPNLYAATQTMQRLMEWTDSVSDGWAYWAKPVRSAQKLITLLYAHNATAFDPVEVTQAELKAAYTPIKSMLTRTGIKGAHEAVFPTSPVTPVGPTEYLVRWEINLTADSPEEAARMASDIMYSPSSLPPVFDVICGDPAVTVRIDTMELPV